MNYVTIINENGKKKRCAVERVNNTLYMCTHKDCENGRIFTPLALYGIYEYYVSIKGKQSLSPFCNPLEYTRQKIHFEQEFLDQLQADALAQKVKECHEKRTGIL